MNHEELLKQARAHWQECTSDAAERDNRQRGREDAAFAAGDQWEEASRRSRKADNRPCLIFNKIPGFLHLVENEQRRNRVSIILSPVDSDSDPELARIDQGLVRYIQYNSKSAASVQAAFMEACRSGLGAFKLRGEYSDPKSFDQDLIIEQIPNAIDRVWWDPFSVVPDRSDSRYWFEASVIPHEVYRQRYPKSQFASDSFMADGVGNMEGDWITERGVRLAHYYYAVETPKTLVELDTGEVMYSDEVPEGAVVRKERDCVERTFKIATINGHEVLDETEWPSRIAPIFVVIGDESYVEGARKRFSLIHFTRDPQSAYNLCRSNEVEAIGLATKAPYTAAEGQIEGYEDQWAAANRSNIAVLPYKPITIDGRTMVPPPQRNTAEPPIQALSIAAAQFADDTKSGVMIFDASIGERSNETSGTAIAQRQQQTGLANLHFGDNLGFAMESCGRAILEVKPFFYDTDRMVRILGKDETQEIVRINGEFVDSKGVSRTYNVASSKYDVRVSAAPSYATARQQAWAQLTEMVRSAPQLMEVAGDLIIRNSDTPGAEAIAERLKKTIPPEITAEKDKGEGAIPPQVQAQMQAMAQQVEQLTTALNETTKAIETKKAELASRERIASMQAMTQIAMKDADLGSRESIEEVRQYLAVLNKRLELLQAERDRQFQPEGPGTDTGAGYPVAA